MSKLRLSFGCWNYDRTRALTAARTEIDRVHESYPDLNDDAFVAAHLDRWLS